MKTKQLSSIISLLLMCGAAKAQVNLQELYNFIAIKFNKLLTIKN